MSTLAWTFMIVTQVLVALVTIFFFRKVLTAKSSQGSYYKDED